MKYREFTAEFERGNVALAYLFEGKEGYLKEEALKRIKKKIILPAEKALQRLLKKGQSCFFLPLYNSIFSGSWA